VSAKHAGRDSVEAFRENYGRALMKLEIDPIPGFEFELDFQVRGIPGFAMAWGRLSPTRNRHTAAMIEDDDVILVHAPKGRGTLRQSGRETSIENGEAVLVSNGEVGEFLGEVPSLLCNFRLDRAMLSSLAVDIDNALMRKIPRDNQALRLLAAYADVVNDNQALASPGLSRSVAQHMHDLTALIVGPTLDGAETAKMRGVRAARLRAIKRHIADGIGRRNLTADDVAAQQGISVDYLRKLFAGEGTSFTDFVLQQRLAQAHRLLTDPRFAAQKISAIAYDVGFGDLSYFNRVFRRQYGCAPSEARARVLE
jgi:AraC-like DNA-binding protein